MGFPKCQFVWFAGILLLSACGKRSLQPFSGYGMGPVNGSPYSSELNPPGSNFYTPQLIVTPSSSVAVGTTATISVTNGSGPYNFRMDLANSNIRFVGASTNVNQAYITSSVPAVVKVYASLVSSGASSLEGQVTLTFTSGGSTTTTTPVSVSPNPSTYACRISGPYYSQYAAYGSLYSWSGNPQVGDVPLFVVSDSYGYSIQITNVWTLNSQETARYYYAWDRFTLNLLSAGSKTVFIKGRSFNTGETCEAQMTFQVGSQPVSLPTPSGGFCGIYPGESRTDIACTMLFRDSYYYNGSSCQYLGVTSGCAASGAFATYQACQSAVSSGSCRTW